MADIELIGTRNRAVRALRDAGLCSAFDHHHVVDRENLHMPRDAVYARVASAVQAGRFPFLYGGDHSTLTGVLTALRDHIGDVGLVLIHGGQADRRPEVRSDQLAVLGPRDGATAWLADCGSWLAPLAEVADDAAGTGRRAVEHLARGLERWWLHVGLDVLDPKEFAAQGPDAGNQSDGLSWDQLTDLVTSLFGAPAHCVGGSIAGYDPDQDPDGVEAGKTVAFVRNALARTTISP
jgi:arginase